MPAADNSSPRHDRPLQHGVLVALLVAASWLPAAGVLAAPVAVFSTYLGGNNAVGTDFASAVTTDGAGNLYVVGTTSGSTDFPTTPGAAQTVKPGGGDGFVVKFDPSGALVYATYLGGSSNDTPRAVAVDATGAVYVAGTTTSVDFPVSAGALQTVFGGGSDAFVAKLSPAGDAIVYATYLGGSDSGEAAHGVAVDGAGRAYVTGTTSSIDFPVTAGAFDTDCGLGGNCTTFAEDVFVATLDAAGSTLVYSTFVGGNQRDVGRQIAIDATGAAFVVGTTESTDFPLQSPFSASSGGSLDGFLLVLDPSGSALQYSTYLGGSGSDLVNGLALDTAGNVYLGGYTRSNDFPTTAGAFDTVCGSGSCTGSLDAFAMKIRPDGAPPIYSTFIGGSGLDFGFGVAVDEDGQLHLGGTTTSLDFPLEDPIQGSLISTPTCALDATGIETGAPCSDLFVTKLSADGSQLLFSDYVGGSDGETNLAVPGFNHNLALNGVGEIHLVGVSHSIDYPLAAPFQGARAGFNDAVITKLGDIPGTDTTPPTADAGPNQSIHAGDPVALDGSGSFDDNTATLDLLYQWSFTGKPAGSGASLAGATTSSPSFVADLPGTFLLELEVTDEAGLVSAPDGVEVSSLNVSPVADAGLDRIVVVGEIVDLDGSASSDADGDPLAYSWSLTTTPAASTATLSDASSALATLEADVVGDYVVALTVDDGFVASPPDEVEITAITAFEQAETDLLEACDYVTALPTGAFDAPGHQNVLCNFLSQAVRDLGQGKISKAIGKIDQTLERADGCAVSGAPDPKGGPGADWILDCPHQEPLFDLLTEARALLE